MNLVKEYITFSPEETSGVGAELFSLIESGTFVALYGDLGAGKTAFVKGLVNAFIPEAIVTSPTYNIVNTYECDGITLHHYDMYRITDEEDLYSVGFFDSLDDSIVVAEWCENIEGAIPESHVKVVIEKDTDNENKRRIKMEFVNVNTRS